MNKNEIVKEWLVIAQKDLDAARFLTKMRPIPVEVICFLCQQSAEKYLKSFLLVKGEEVIKTHDLVLLNDKCLNHDKDFQKIVDECVFLTPFGVKARYPFQLEILEEDMWYALKCAEKVQDLVLSKLY